MLNPEHVLVPYETAPLPEGPWLVFAPHADDETFGMGGSLLRARDAGIETHVLVLTDGALGGTQPDLVEVREQEVQKATAMLGVATLTCWSEGDRTLTAETRLVQAAAAAIAACAPASVFFPAPLELHPDHRATAALVWAALQQLAARGGQAPAAYGYEISVQSPVNRLIDITAQLPEKEQVMAIYASQNSQNSYPDLVLSLNRARTFTLPETVPYAEALCHYPPDALSLSLQQATQQLLDRYFQQ